MSLAPFAKLLMAGLLGGSAYVLAGINSGSGAVQAPLNPAIGTPADWSMGEMKERVAIFNEVDRLLHEQDYAALNSLEAKYRTTRARTSSGTWKLDFYHSAVMASLPRTHPSMDCAFAAEALIDDWLAVDANAPAPIIAKAQAMLDRAWCFRGAGYAAAVDEGMWRPFHDNVRAAGEWLAEHKQVAAVDPGYYAVKIEVDRAMQRPDALWTVLSEAASKEPYYYGTYARAYQSVLPQWGGSVTQIRDLAKFAVAKTRDSDGAGAYARFFWYAREGGCECWRQAIDWNEMKVAMQDIAKRNPNPWNLAHFARFGCEFGDKQTAHIYFSRLGTTDASEAWPSRSQYEQCRSFAGA